jgi:hypothetical protein
MFEQTCHTQFRPSEHPEKTSNNKKLLHIIQKNGFRLLLSTAENGWGLYGLLNIQKGEKAKIAQQQSCND